MISIFMQPPTHDAIRDQIQSQVQAEITAAQQGAGDAAAQRVVRIRTGQDGERTTTIALPPDFARNMIPPQVVDLGLAFFFTMAFIIVGLPIARAFARRMDRSRVNPAIPAGLSAQITQLTQAVDTIAIEVERISEGQRFTTRLLSEQQKETPRIT